MSSCGSSGRTHSLKFLEVRDVVVGDVLQREVNVASLTAKQSLHAASLELECASPWLQITGNVIHNHLYRNHMGLDVKEHCLQQEEARALAKRCGAIESTITHNSTLSVLSRESDHTELKKKKDLSIGLH